jgi:RNA polymerase sigma-70 factor, ECF subfamily
MFGEVRDEGTHEKGETPSAEASDEELMQRLSGGDPSALDVLFERYGRLALSIAGRILRDPGDAEDAVQESFFYLYRKASAFDPAKGSARSWVVQAIYHRTLNYREYLHRRHFYLGTEGALEPDALKGTTDLDREVGSTLDRRFLEKAFEELEERQRKTLELYFFEGLDLREISERLEEPLGNVRHHYYRGLEKLKGSAVLKKFRKP